MFTVSGDFDAYQIRGNNDETVGFASLGCRITPNAKIYAQNKGTASASIEGAVTADGKTKNHICIPEQPVFLDGFDLVLLKGGKTVKRFYTEEPFEVILHRNLLISSSLQIHINPRFLLLALWILEQQRQRTATL